MLGFDLVKNYNHTIMAEKQIFIPDSEIVTHHDREWNSELKIKDSENCSGCQYSRFLSVNNPSVEVGSVQFDACKRNEMIGTENAGQKVDCIMEEVAPEVANFISVMRSEYPHSVINPNQVTQRVLVGLRESLNSFEPKQIKDRISSVLKDIMTELR